MHLEKRRGVSELYASMLMVAVTLAFGGAASALAMGQFGLAASSASLSGSLAQRSSGTQVSLIYAYAGQGSCPAYKGAPEGTTLSLILSDYGSSRFAPVAAFVNGTIYASNYPVVSPGGTATVAIPLLPSGTCAHSSGQTVLLVDSDGDEVQFAT